MMDVWNAFINHWLSSFWIWIGMALLVIGFWKAVDEIRFRVERRRYRRATRP